MAPRQNTKDEDWYCKTCFGITPKTEHQHYTNFGSRKSCNSCGATKGDCFGGKGKAGKGQGKGNNKKDGADSSSPSIKQLHARIAQLEKEKEKTIPENTTDEPKPAADAATAQLQAEFKKLEALYAATKDLGPGDHLFEQKAGTEEKFKAAKQRLLEAKPPGARLAAAKGNVKKREAAHDKAKAARFVCEKVVEEAQAELEKAVSAEATAAESVAAAKTELEAATTASNGAATPPAATPPPLEGVQQLVAALLEAHGNDPARVLAVMQLQQQQQQQHKQLEPQQQLQQPQRNEPQSLAPADGEDEVSMEAEEDGLDELDGLLASIGEEGDSPERKAKIDAAKKKLAAGKERARSSGVAKKTLKSSA